MAAETESKSEHDLSDLIPVKDSNGKIQRIRVSFNLISQFASCCNIVYLFFHTQSLVTGELIDESRAEGFVETLNDTKSMLEMATLAGKLDLVLLGGGVMAKNDGNLTNENNDSFELVGKFLIADLVKFEESSFDCSTGSVKKGDQCGK